MSYISITCTKHGKRFMKKASPACITTFPMCFTTYVTHTSDFKRIVPRQVQTRRSVQLFFFFAFAVLQDLRNKTRFFLFSHITMLFKSAHRHNSAWNWVTYLFMLSIAYVAFFEVDCCKKDLQAVLHEPSSYQEVANIIPVCTCFHLPLPIDTCIVCVCVWTGQVKHLP